MKYALVILFLAAAVIPSVPQRTNQIPVNPLSMDLGNMKVWMGMPKAQFSEAAKSAGYKMYDSTTDENEVTVSSGSSAALTLYEVRFNKIGLSYASRVWADTNRTPYEAMLGALGTLDAQKCDVSHEPLNTPENNLDRVFINCGSGRSILIMYGKMSYSPSSFGAIYERIGSR